MSQVSKFEIFSKFLIEFGFLFVKHVTESFTYYCMFICFPLSDNKDIIKSFLKTILIQIAFLTCMFFQWKWLIIIK